MKTLNRLVFVLALLGAYSLPGRAVAIGESSARALGMGATYTAVARNLDAVGWNPANLALPSDLKLQVAIFSGGAGVGNDGLSLEDYNRWNGEFWDDTDKQEILSRIPPDGVTLNTSVEARALGFSYGAFAFRAVSFGSGRGRLPKDPFELLLYGNDAARTYTINDAEGKGQAVWNLSVSGARQIDLDRFETFAVGATVRYLNGIGYFEAENISGSLATTGAGLVLNGQADTRRAEGGSGFSFDVGAVARVDDRWTAGVSLIQVGRMSWSKDARAYTGSVRTDSLKVEDLVEVEQFDDLFNPDDGERAVDSFTASLPTMLRFGIARVADRSTVAVDWQQGLNNGPGATTRPRVSVGGVPLMTGWLPVRAGISFGGRIRRAYTLGFGLGRHRLAFDLAVRIRKGITPNSASGVGMSTELKIGF